MISNLVLSILTALFTIAAVTSSVASSRYARQAKAAAERAASARERIEDLRREQPPGPTHLTREQLYPLAAALHRREAAVLAGRGLLHPFPDCPTCGQPPTELAVCNDHPDYFLTDRVAFRFRPCGHTFTADGEDLHHAYEQARRETP